jgi:hypothetical protein
MGFTITLTKYGSTWHGWVKNDVGGGGNCDGPNRVTCLTYALRMLPPNTPYNVIVTKPYETTGRTVAAGVKRGPCTHAPEQNPRGCFLCIGTEAGQILNAR